MLKSEMPKLTTLAKSLISWVCIILFLEWRYYYFFLVGKK
jgi:hypothetical protein